MLVALRLCSVVGVAALAVPVSMLTYLKLALDVLRFRDLPIMCGNPHGSVADSSMCGASGLCGTRRTMQQLYVARGLTMQRPPP